MIVFEIQHEQVEMLHLLEDWTRDPSGVKAVFERLGNALSKTENTTFSFKARPGVSYSLRAWAKGPYARKTLFALVDVIDDDPENRWLSVCFYEEMITDPEELGNIVPNGILGDDGHCFDLFEYDASLFSYLEKRISEAYGAAVSIH
jgi:hypothetical protein